MLDTDICSDRCTREYGNPCQSIIDGKEVDVQPLEGLESIEIDGKRDDHLRIQDGAMMRWDPRCKKPMSTLQASFLSQMSQVLFSSSGSVSASDSEPSQTPIMGCIAWICQKRNTSLEGTVRKVTLELLPFLDPDR